MKVSPICGNDITSSCLYVSSLSIIYAGQWAWVSLLIVSVVLYFYRSIYSEVVGALPLNGGAYNALLNTTSKFIASLAACLTLLSYMATAVISANEAMHYLQILWQGLPVFEATITLLAVFMLLTIMGIGESAKVATAIFLLHLTTIFILIVAGAWGIAHMGWNVFLENFHRPVEGSLAMALFLGFSAAMLGISGFESSANFVEEQQEGVFPKTLRNMWLAVTVINPIMAFLALSLIPVKEIAGHQEALLSYLGSITGGSWLAGLISIDAMLVLSGAVLTSFIGVTGLVHRMVLDRCLPQVLMKRNRYGVQYRIVIAFFLLSVSVLCVTQGKLSTLAGVYTISFLSVMALFGLGNLLLKLRRSGLKRPTRAPWASVLIAIAAVIAALIGNVLINPVYVGIFFEYFLPTVIIVLIMLNRVFLLSSCLSLIQEISRKLNYATEALSYLLQNKIDTINSQQIVFFTRGGDLSNLNLALIYVRNNEHTNRMKIVTVVKDDSQVPKNLSQDIRFLDRAYPEIDIEFVIQHGEFGPKLIQELSQKWNVPTNFMFIGSPNAGFTHNLADLGGVRLII
jgi:amino acid transporter